LLTPEQRGYTETIQTCGENLLTVINDILDFSKIESGKMELEEKDYDLRTCIEEVLDIFAPRAAQADLDLVYQIDNDVPTQIRGDSTRLRQILINLVGNAIKFTHEGEVFIHVHKAGNKKDNEVELGFVVSDTGIGIPTDKLNHLFKAFSQVDSSTTRKYGGTGLGLVICEKLIHLMRGTIKVESEPGKGSVFTFTIRSKMSQRGTHTYLHCNMEEMEGKQVLVVDDNATNRNILQLQLLQWKMTPVMASSGKQALDVLSWNNRIELVITDMHMPEMDGLDLASEIRGLYDHIPIILLSSVGDDHCKKYPELFNSILTKPVRQNILCKHILDNLGKKGKIVGEKEQKNGQLSENFAAKYPLQILVAEDNPFNQILATTILTKLGYVPQLAENGYDATVLAAKETYDIILMDVQMPVMDGLEATRALRENQSYRPVIIAMTANAMQGDKEECLAAGMDDYLSKPVKPEEIMHMLEKWALKIKPD
jgi:CheY-like chemotaxis protein